MTVPYVRIICDGSVIFIGSGRSGGGGSNSGPCSDNSGSGNSGQSDHDDDDDPGSTTTRDRRTESGLRDITLATRYYFIDEQDWIPSVNVTGRVKFPTTEEEKSLGTGEFDYGLGAVQGVRNIAVS